MKDLFVSFLKQENAFDLFVAVFSEEDGIENYLDELSEEPNYYITDAFSWGSEYMYWSGLNMKWLDLLEQQQNETNN